MLISQIIQIFAASPCSSPWFFGLEPWWHFLGNNFQTTTDSLGRTVCQINFTVLGHKSDILLVLLAIIDDFLRIAALVALGFVFYGAFQYVASQGSPDRTAKAQNTIIDALIGLVIATISVAFVAFLGNSLGGINK